MKPRRNLLWVLIAVTVVVLAGTARAGGPLLVHGPSIGPLEGQPLVWNTASEVQYYTDGGSLGQLTNSQAVSRVQTAFQVWEDIPTAILGYERVGGLTSVSDGDVSTAPEYDEAISACFNQGQSVVLFDAGGTLFSDLGVDPGVIGFAGPCLLTDRINTAFAALNGRYLDGIDTASNPELPGDEFDAVLIHEFGHFSGLDHSQINSNCLNGCPADDMEGLPTMFPILLGGAQKTLSTDDVAWFSRLYPSPGQAGSFGGIGGQILYSDNLTALQGGNVVARLVDDVATPENESRRIAVSVVSGYLFVGNPGQRITGNNDGDFLGARKLSLLGSFDLSLPPGTYTLEVESIDAAFGGGSGVGPLSPPLPLPGAGAEFWNTGESDTDDTAVKDPIVVGAGATVAGIHIILNGTPPAQDTFEGVR